MRYVTSSSCLRYCKSTIFQANHNRNEPLSYWSIVVCDTAKVRFFKQITTDKSKALRGRLLFAILQKYDFSSKSQLRNIILFAFWSCLRYCKSTIFQANHNLCACACAIASVVCDTAKVRFFKQITTHISRWNAWSRLFAILQKYDFSSKSQQWGWTTHIPGVVCDTAKVRFFKQITTWHVVDTYWSCLDF